MDDAGAPDSRGGLLPDRGGAAGDAAEERSIEVSVSSPGGAAAAPAGGAPEIPEIVLTQALWRQIRSLQETEREVQERLERQRVQQLVDKVEDEVEYEGILDDVCSRIRAEEEAMDLERRDREWELERREEELEEEVEVLKDKVRRLEEELRMAQFGIRDPDDAIIQKMLYEERGGGAAGEDDLVPKDIEVLEGGGDGGGGGGSQRPLTNPTHEILVAFEDMLKEADERHDREKKALAETVAEMERSERRFRHERYEWRARIKQMESQTMVMEKEIGRAAAMVKERDCAAAAEKQRRVAAEEEAVKFSGLLKDEKLAHKVAELKIKKLEGFVKILKEKVSRADRGDCSGVLAEIEKELGKVSSVFGLKRDPSKAIESEQFDALKQQRDAAFADRDRLEEKLNRMLKRSRDRESEIDAMWLEREKLLIEKMTSLEEQADRYEEDLAAKRKQDAGSCRKDWDDERFALREAIRERDDAVRRIEAERDRILSEIETLKAVHQQLLGDLALYKQQGTDDRSDPSMISGPEPDRTPDRSCSKTSDDAESGAQSERSELEEKVVDTLSLVEELKNKMSEKETQMQWERKQLESIINSRTAEAESLQSRLELTEFESKTRVDRLRNEMQRIEQELQRERSENESDRNKLVVGMQKRVNEMLQEISSQRSELRVKDEEIEFLRREKRIDEARISTAMAAQSELEDEVSRLNAELSLAVGAHQESSDRTDDAISSSRHEEWQFALEKVADFDKQIGEAMLAIQSLREELCSKEAELQKARSEPEMELERREGIWRRSEQKILGEKTDLVKMLEAERSESSDAIAVLSGTIRELEWALIKKTPDASLESLFKNKTAKGDEMVKVRASYLKEVDEYIGELKGKIEAMEGSKTRRSAREEELDDALLRMEKEMMSSVSPERRSIRLIKYSSPGSARPRSIERSLSSFQPGTSTDRSWNLGGPISCLSRDSNTIQDRWTTPDLPPSQEALALAVPPRQQKKWIVDTAWLDQVRKEHSLLTQQLAIERQRVADLNQVEADNQWLEAMMLRALERKKECELQLHSKISR